MTEKAQRPACAMCGKPQEKEYAPFCSKRCADLDLHRWFSGSYRVAAVEDEEEKPPEESEF